jgi:hypothetical protein
MVNGASVSAAWVGSAAPTGSALREISFSIEIEPMERPGIELWQQQTVHEVHITIPADGSKLNLRLEVFSRASDQEGERHFAVKVFRRDLFRVEPIDPGGFGEASHEWYVVDPLFPEFELPAANAESALAGAIDKILDQLGLT